MESIKFYSIIKFHQIAYSGLLICKVQKPGVEPVVWSYTTYSPWSDGVDQTEETQHADAPDDGQREHKQALSGNSPSYKF